VIPDRATVPSREDKLEERLPRAVRLLLWNYERGSLPYDVACLVLLILLLLVPGAWWGDPMGTGR
jgi:hypothetical protein